MIAHFLLALAAATTLQQQTAIAAARPETGLVWGQVRSESTGAPLQYAVIEVVTAERLPMHAETDSAGIYVLRNVPAGRRLIRATHIDHAPHEIEVIVAPGRQLYVDFELPLRPVRLPVVNAHVRTGQGPLIDTTAVGAPELGAATVHVLEATPGVAEFGLAEAIKDVPGYEPPDPSDVLFVRGAAEDLKLVLLNGAPVYSPFHIGGLINALDPEMLSSATLYLGGAPARYDGGLSYVMDLETRAGRSGSPHMDLSVDMLAARGVAEGPVGTSGISYMVGGRAVHGLGAKPFVTDPFPYTYGDGLGRIDVDLGPNGSLSATGFWNQESVRLDSTGAVDQVVTWGNRAGSLRYRGQIGNADALVTAALGRFVTRLPLGGLEPLTTEGVSQRVRLAIDFSQEFGPLRIFYGGSFDRLRLEQRAWPRGDSADFKMLEAAGQGDVTGVYVDGTVTPTRRLRFRGGVRADIFSLSPSVRLAPRLSATVLVTDRTAITIAAGRYRQYVREPDKSLVSLGSTPVPDIQLSQSLSVAEASHLVLSLDQDLGEGLRLGVEGFYKVFDGLPAESGETAEASGVDLWVRRNTGSVTGWFGYSLAWVWSSEDAPLISTDRIFAGRHLVSAGLAGPLIGSGEFDVRVAYGAGLPFTAIPEPEATTPVFGTGVSSLGPAATLVEPTPSSPSEPNQPYLRIDARIARTWDAELNGFAFEFTPYFKVLNALDRRDALFYHFDRNSAGEPRALAALPVLPIFGVEWKF